MKNWYSKIICVMSALPVELDISDIEPKMTSISSSASLGKENIGVWNGRGVVVSYCGAGKVNAAACTQRLIDNYELSHIIFVGYSGGLSPSLKQGSSVVVQAAIDADMDVRPWNASYMKGEVPFSRDRVYFSDSKLIERLENRSVPGLDKLADGKLLKSYAATGSSFLNEMGKSNFVAGLPDLEAVIDGKKQLPGLYDMESSAVLQVANSNNLPALVIRTISDGVKGDAASDFNNFNVSEKHAQILDDILKIIS